jgi:putative two-component system response regulator
MYLGNPVAALPPISRARDLGDAMPPRIASDFLNLTVRELTFLDVVLALDKRQDAHESLERCYLFARKTGGIRANFLAALAQGSYTCKYGDMQHGLEILRAALEHPAATNTSERLVVLKMLAKAHDEAQQPELALEYLRQLLSETRRLREQGILAITRRSPEAVARSILPESIDLMSLTLKEADLRAQVAERSAERSQIEQLERLAISADLREEFSGAHGYRVGALSSEVALAIGFTAEDAYELELAAKLHDIGKIAVPDRILLSPAALAETERQFICAHTAMGADMLSGSTSRRIRLAEVIARCHHEWWNGEGYPSKLSGNRIPIHARIVALADVFDALTHGRPFSPAWPVEKALAEIRSRRGTQFDPELTDLFLNLMERLISEHEDLDAYLGRASQHSPFLQARAKIRRMLDDHRENERRATVAGNDTRH